jgi:mono/diheme cytochrome c family protein
MRSLVMLLMVFGLGACVHSGETGASEASLVETGHRVAQIKCASCHAVEGGGASRDPDAPPFREVSRAVAITATEQSLAEGIRIGHHDMPPVRLSRSEMEALSAYLRSLQGS